MAWLLLTSRNPRMEEYKSSHLETSVGRSRALIPKPGASLCSVRNLPVRRDSCNLYSMRAVDIRIRNGYASIFFRAAAGHWFKRPVQTLAGHRRCARSACAGPAGTALGDRSGACKKRDKKGSVRPCRRLLAACGFYARDGTAESDSKWSQQVLKGQRAF